MNDLCYCGWAGVDSHGCVCGKSCSIEGCEEHVSVGSGKLILCEFHLHFHLAAQAADA